MAGCTSRRGRLRAYSVGSGGSPGAAWSSAALPPALLPPPARRGRCAAFGAAAFPRFAGGAGSAAGSPGRCELPCHKDVSLRS